MTCCSPESASVKYDNGSNTLTISSSVVNSSSFIQSFWSSASTAHIACCCAIMHENILDVEPQQVLISAINLCFGKLSAPAFVVRHGSFSNCE